MEEQQQSAALATTFPSPPPFWQSFTPENLRRISELRDQEAGVTKKKHDASKEIPIRLLDLPAELRFLQPPEPLTEGRYRVFGDLYDLADPLPTLDEMGIRSLYTPPATPTGSGEHADRALVLKRIAKSLLLNFLELIGIMSIDPEQYVEKVDDLRTLFINFHHLLNEYRPHQARESLILMMQDQLDNSKKETERIRLMKQKVEGILEGLSQATMAEEDVDMVQPKESSHEEEGKVAWEELEKVFGGVEDQNDVDQLSRIRTI